MIPWHAYFYSRVRQIFAHEMSTTPYHSDSSTHKVQTFVDILRPIIKVNQLVGVCPLEISENSVKLRFKSFRTLYTLLVLLILTVYFAYGCYQFVCSFGRGRSVPEIVSMVTFVASTLMPIAMQLLTLVKWEQLGHFLETSNEFQVSLHATMKCHRSLGYMRKLMTIYIFLALGSLFVVALEVIRKPSRDIFVVALVSRPSQTSVTLGCLFQCYLVILKSCGTAFIEVLCCCVGATFQSTVASIIQELHEIVGVNNPAYRKGQGYLRQPASFNMGHRCSCVIATMENGQEINNPTNSATKSTSENELLLRISPGFYYGVNSELELIPPRPRRCSVPVQGSSLPHHHTSRSRKISSVSCDLPPGTNMPSKDPKDGPNQGAEPLIRAIKKFNYVSSMQNLLNNIAGPVLALDIALLVLISCLLLYLKIHYLGSRNVDYIDGIVFVGNCIIYFVRLVIVFISLGNVHEMSIHFNDCVTTSLMHVKNPDPVEINLVLAHLTSQFANPSSFSAAGLFVFSRASLLAVLSAIMTYVVFLLQAKM